MKKKNRKLLVCLVLITSFINCPGGGGGSDITPILFLLMGGSTSSGSGKTTTPTTSVAPCMEKNSFTISSATAWTFSGLPYFYSSVKTYTLSPSKPSSIFYTKQDHPFTNPNTDYRPVFPTFYDSNGSNYQGREGWNVFTVTSMSPYGYNGFYYVNKFINNTLSAGQINAVDFNFPTNPATTNASASIITNCRTLDSDERSFSASGGSSSTNGMSKIWTNRKKLNVNLIFIKDGNTRAYPDPTQSGLQTALNRWKAIYSQDSVKIDIQFTVAELDSAEFLSLASLSTDFYNTNGSLGKLFSSTSSVQSDVALNLYIAREETEVGGVLGISGGIPGSVGLKGTPQSGMVVFIEPHRSSGALGSILSVADQNFLGDTMAHEAGHFLGLFHTVESAGQSGAGTPNYTMDPLIETPLCTSSRNTNGNGRVDISECSGTGFFDSGSLNLMFWAGDGVTQQTQLTGEQGWVLRLNPLVY
ncbi:hypothetical protein JWG45_19445 [Leptospira sp. 201903070]|uniref:Peptidase M43 pregnancy-associated plasma-A domain-containing protein n=1 Tax=Leptospira ainlahdjerensis TaxID=2810033 RepID=A0ABS2UG22_9LEPT|nr:M43 family zinc metalloprotease [Leptospira ainlahdjerensis]MBM9579322.1 hypothetical protein [Leptospira ainlahdjerensis]